MRILTSAVLCIMLIAPTLAHADNTPHVFGSTTCRQTFPCPSSEQSLSPDQFADLGNVCMSSGIGLGGAGQYFDPVAGLDSNNCLTPNSLDSSSGDSSNAKTRTSMEPVCCVVTLSENICAFHCQLLSVAK